MENDHKMLTGSSIEKAKALFEYEMTSVLLAFTEEQEAAQERLRRRYARYAEMEIEKPRAEYEAPEFSPVVECAPPESISAVPEMTLPEIKAEISGIPQPGETAPFAAPVMPKPPRLPGGLLPEGAVRTESTALPDILPQEQHLKAPDITLPEAEISAEWIRGAAVSGFVPEVPETNSIPEVSAPALSGAAKVNVSAPEMPETPKRITVPDITADKEVAPPEITLPEIAEVSIGSIAEDAPAVRIASGYPDKLPGAGVSFAQPEIGISADAFSQTDMPPLPEITVPGGELPQIAVSADIGGDVSLAGQRAEFTAPEAEPVRVRVSYIAPVPVSFEAAKAPRVKMSAPAYPEIPDMPDMTAAAEEIIEAVRAEI